VNRVGRRPNLWYNHRMTAAVLKNLVRDFIPPMMLRALRPRAAEPDPPQYGFFGDYASFAEAAAVATGYDVHSVAERTAASLASFVNGFSLPAIIDSRIQQMHSVFTIIAQKKGRLRVLDVGGAAGVYYFYLSALSPWLDLEWTVLELPSVAKACQTLQCPIRYVDDTAQLASTYDVVFASGSLQYFERPYDGIDLCLTEGRQVILNRVPIHRSDRDIIKVQRVPPHLHAASMPVWFFGEEKLLSFIRTRGSIDITWDVVADENFWIQGGASAMRGYLTLAH
jgi:putative methyltransferase (TIGR04325 family)